MKLFRKQKKKACPPCLKHSFCRRGFTLVEMLVAVSIFTASILALLGILAQGISNTGYAKRKMIASYLAQEGVEYMKICGILICFILAERRQAGIILMPPWLIFLPATGERWLLY